LQSVAICLEYGIMTFCCTITSMHRACQLVVQPKNIPRYLIVHNAEHGLAPSDGPDTRYVQITKNSICKSKCQPVIYVHNCFVKKHRIKLHLPYASTDVS